MVGIRFVGSAKKFDKGLARLRDAQNEVADQENGIDEVPAESFKCFCNRKELFVAEMCNSVWHHLVVPDMWHAATVAAV